LLTHRVFLIKETLRQKDPRVVYKFFLELKDLKGQIIKVTRINLKKAGTSITLPSIRTLLRYLKT